ncbi:MAG: sugar phosphate nucleotidyltransferase [Candidatus Moranbacteria bacterium]|nr:sugar phosphate nucleotidyltransferase [Candidatus Moranbacteria bacterium]
MKITSQNFYAVIMAGGTGSRLWPVSRKEKPKQFQKFTSFSRTMIQETYTRTAKAVPPENIFVSTVEEYRDLALAQLPDLKKDQLIIEPVPRGTAPAMSLIASRIKKINPQAVVATIPSDHAIRNAEEFVSSIKAALETVEKHPDKLATVGINPTSPDTNLGYIKMGKEFSNSNKKRIFYVDSFVEKPDKKKAEEYFASWEYLWNGGYFIFAARTFLNWVKKFTPEIYSVINDQRTKNSIFLEKYKKLENIPVEPAIVEKLPPENRLVVPSELQWSDVGNWGTLFDFFKDSLESEMIVKGNHIDVGSKNCLIYSEDKLVATIGLKNTIIVETDDAILVANRNKVGEVKKIIDKLKAEGKHLYL